MPEQCANYTAYGPKGEGISPLTEYMKIEVSWRQLAENQDWLDGKLYPAARPLSCR